MNQCPYCNVNIAKGYVGEVELESHLKEIHEVSFETMHEAEAWWDKKYVPFGRPSWADMNIGQRRQTINAYLTRSPSTEMRGFLKCPKCGITFNDSENTDDELTIHLMKEHQVPEDLAEEITTFEVGSNESKANEGPLQRFYCLDCDWEGNRNYDAIVHETEFQTHNVDERYIDESKAKEDYYNLSSDDYDDMIDEEPDDPDPESVLPDEYYDMKNHDKLNFGGDSKASEEDPNPSKMFLDQLQNAGRDGNPSMYWNEEEKQYTNDPLRNVSFDPKAGAPWQKNADLESLASEFEIKDLQEDSKMTDEGFVDKIDMLANKMGVNLDRDPEQVESVANEEEREFYTDRPYNPDEPANDGSYPKCKSCHGWGYIEIPHLGIMDKCGHCGGTGKEPSEKLY